MKKIYLFLKKHYPFLIILILPSIILFGLQNDDSSWFIIKSSLFLAIIMGVILFIALALLIKYAISLLIKGLKEGDSDMIGLAIKIVVGIIVFVLYILYHNEIDNFLF